MNLFADESVDRQIVDRLRQAGFSVPFVAEMESGISDDIVLDRANQAQAVLLTADKDFGELVYRQKRIARGVILVRFAGLPPDRKAEITMTAIRRHENELANTFTVITAGTVRVRHNRS
ncbi:MAG: DUF5615 family PIN-like protein [Chloroflexi bacterium]|nr:DUF5615 family PIN-like protein [Chloroflexota bacterium]